jgi:hypothetical protein
MIAQLSHRCSTHRMKEEAGVLGGAASPLGLRSRGEGVAKERPPGEERLQDSMSDFAATDCRYRFKFQSN